MTDKNISEKPVVQIKDALFVGRIIDVDSPDKVVIQQGRLMGKTVNHPTLSNSTRHTAFTSNIVAVSGNRVETENTLYEVLSWYEPMPMPVPEAA